MALKPNFTQADIRRKLEQDAKRIEQVIILRLAALGEECVNEARNNGSYIDQTGNLRSSTGYIIARDGKVLTQFFETANKDDGGKGASTGRKLALELLLGYQKGYVLIVVAGMNYAAKVEARGRNVLASAESYAMKELPGLKAQLARQVARMK